MNARELADKLMTIRSDYDRAKSEAKARGDAAIAHYNAYRATIGAPPLDEYGEKQVARERLDMAIERTAIEEIFKAIDAWWPGRIRNPTSD